MNDLKFSIIIVCLNAGGKLRPTVDSVLRQSYANFEIVVKDGKSVDRSVEELTRAVSDDRLHIYEKADSGIYDAMNQAAELADGDYFVFINAGDSLYDDDVLEKIADAILSGGGEPPDIIYGDIYHKGLSTVIKSAPEINDFTCYRNVPCHQSCFYAYHLFGERGYDTQYNVRADYEHFLWCYYVKKAKIRYAPVTVASYEGGGYSEADGNRRLSYRQHREITLKYMGKNKTARYALLMTLSLAPLRAKISQSKRFSGVYNRLKSSIYNRRKS